MAEKLREINEKLVNFYCGNVRIEVKIELNNMKIENEKITLEKERMKETESELGKNKPVVHRTEWSKVEDTTELKDKIEMEI